MTKKQDSLTVRESLNTSDLIVLQGFRSLQLKNETNNSFVVPSFVVVKVI